MNSLVREVARAIERSTQVVCKVHRYEVEQPGRIVRPGDDVKLEPAERYSDAVSILRLVNRLPPYEHAVVVGLAGESSMLEGAINVLLDVVDRDALGDGPAREAISHWMRGKGMSKRQLSKEYGGSSDTHLRYRNRVADELDCYLTRACAMCRHEM